MILNIVSVFIGGGIGSVLRYLMGGFYSRHLSFSFPCATFAVNILSCFIIGLAVSYFMSKTEYSPAVKLAITVGFCGGLSTFSTFSVETIDLLQNGQYFVSFLYISLTVIACLAATFIGLRI